MNMKILYKLLLIWVIIFLMVACTKTISNEGQNNVVTEKLDSVQINEPVLLSFDNGNSATAVSWIVTPNDSFTIAKAGAYATFYFGAAGTYNIVAMANNKQATYQVKVINKLYNNVATGFAVTATKVIGVLPNEVIQFNIQNASSNVQWTTIGTQGLMSIASNTLSAAISFRTGSTGTVIASDSVHSQSRTIWLSDTNNNTAMVAVPFIFSDKINITPSVITDTSGNKTLLLSAKTTYKYQSSTDQIINLSTIYKGTCLLNYGGVTMAAVPQSNVTTANCVNSFSGLAAGTYPLTVEYSNLTFTGSITVTTSGVFTFNWLPNSYVSIYPLTVQ